MSDVSPTAAPAATTEPTTTVEPTTVAAPETAAATTEPVVAPVDEVKPEEPVAAAAATSEEVAPTEEKAEEKVIEPISEGQLSYKGPGLVKSLIPSKKEFWLSDEAVTPQNLDLYLRGEKPEISHPVVAWASQTGKGLLFFNKKGDTNREHPHSVLALYDATDLKKASGHEITFRLHGHPHTLKASNDAERDGWYLSIEKAHELGKAEKETLRESEGYKAEIEKLNKPSIAAASAAAGGAAGALRSKSQGKKSVELDRAQREGSDVDEETKKAQKSRSTSRGMLNRLKGKKEEVEAKHEEKKEEKEADKAEPEATETVPATDAAIVAPAVDAVPSEAAVEPAVDADKVEEKPKPSKRGSIFGKMQGWGGIKSPSKEKDAKDAELKPEVPVKDEAAPQIPESVTADATTEPTLETTPVEPAKEAEPASPSTQSRNFLSGLSFMNKRGRSVSPSANMKDAPKKEETVEPVVAAPETAVAEPVAEPTALPEAPVDESAKTETTTANKRQSVFGNLGRRASKALNRMQAPKKESTAAPTEAAAEDTTEAAAPVESETPAVNGTTESAPAEANQASIGDVVPEAVNVGQPQSTPVVTASA